MRVLLDESLPRGLVRHFTEGEIETVFDRGWSGLNNGDLLRLASVDFDVFITADQNLQYQQNLAGFEIGVVVLAAPSNRLQDLLPLLREAGEASQSARPGEVRIVGGKRRPGAS